MKKMNFEQAKQYMLSGGRVTLPTWNKEDFLYIEDSVILNDGGSPHLKHLRESELNSREWRAHKDDRECMMCGQPFDKDSLIGARYEKEFKMCESCKEGEDG